MKASTRTYLGPVFSEGCRLAWMALERRGWSRSSLRRQLRGKDGEELSIGVIDRVLYGDRPPSLLLAVQLSDVLKIRVRAWLEEPSQAFVLPAEKRQHDAAA